MLSFFKNLLGTGEVVDTATKIIDKIAGTDWTTKERAQFILDYQEATKHQSPARRLIAVMVSCAWCVLVLTWLVCVMLGQFMGMDAATNIANSVKIFMVDTISQPFNLVIAFYFGVSFAKTFSK
jgi:hypothetical protein